MKVLSNVFWISAVFLSDVMCVVVAYNYCNMAWGIRYAGYSAPASSAFLFASPYCNRYCYLHYSGVLFQAKSKITASEPVK